MSILCAHVALASIAGGCEQKAKGERSVVDNHGSATNHGKHGFIRGQLGFLQVADRDDLLRKENNVDQWALVEGETKGARTAECVYRRPRHDVCPPTLGIDAYRERSSLEVGS